MARVVGAFTPCALLSTMPGKYPVLENREGQNGGDGSALCTGMFGDFLLKSSSRHLPELQRTWGPGVPGLMCLARSLFVVKKIKQRGQKYDWLRQPCCPSVWSSHPSCTTHSSVFTLLLLCACPQGLTALVPTCAFWRPHLCPADTTSLVLPLCWQDSSSSACYPWVSISQQFVRSAISFYKPWGADLYLA